MNHLLHPELFNEIPFVGNRIGENLSNRAEEISSQGFIFGGISVAIRARNEATQLDILLEDIRSQDVRAELEIIVVDNESTDHTAAVAYEHGAQVVTLPRDKFTYPRSMNLGMEAASFDNVFLTVGHATLSNTQALRAGLAQMNKPNVAGSFSRVLPSATASRIERYSGIGNLPFTKHEQQIKKAGLGIMAATCSFVDRSAWQDLGGFDERYQSGGEDTALAAKMLQSGMIIMEEPLLAVHHSHGLGLRDTVKQWKHWIKTVSAPQELDQDALLDRRPDLRAKYEE